MIEVCVLERIELTEGCFRLEVNDSQVKAVYLAACHLKMDRVVKECMRHLIKNLSVDNCIETRSLPGIAKNKTFVDQVDAFIAREVRPYSGISDTDSCKC